MLKCRICSYEARDLKNHLKRKHNKMTVTAYIKEFGESPIDPAVLKARADRQSAKRLHCHLCEYMTLSENELRQHFAQSEDVAHSHHAYTGTDGIDYLTCKICQLRRTRIDHHVKQCHDIDIDDYKSRFKIQHVICRKLVEDNRELNGMKSEESREKRRGQNNPFYDKAHDDDAKSRMRETLKQTMAERYPDGHYNEGHIHTDEFKRNQSVRGTKFTYGRGGFREDLGHYCRSRLEANYARILKHLGKPYSWEPTTFMVTMPDGETSAYTPDFYLPDEDLYVETKPYTMLDGTYRNSEKIELFKLQHPNINFKMIVQQSPEWQSLKAQYSPIIPQWE